MKTRKKGKKIFKQHKLNAKKWSFCEDCMKKKRNAAAFMAGGAAIGALNGLLGGGGGMVAVPLLRKTGLPALKAHATAIAVIAPASALSGAVYLFVGSVPSAVLLPAALGVALGGFLGAKLLSVLPVRIVEVVFAALMLLAGLRLVF